MRDFLALIVCVLLITVILKPENVGQWAQRLQQGFSEPVKR